MGRWLQGWGTTPPCSTPVHLAEPCQARGAAHPGRDGCQARSTGARRSRVCCVCVSERGRPCTWACVCLGVQHGKVTAGERRRQPRKGLGMESVRQIGAQGGQERPAPAPPGHGSHLRHGRSGAEGAESSRGWARRLPRGIWAGQGPRGARRSRAARGARLQGSEEEPGGEREGLSLFLCTTVSCLLAARCPGDLPLVSLLTAALCSLQGRGGQHPSAGEAAGHRGESLLRPASPCPQVVTRSTRGRCQRGGGCRGAGDTEQGVSSSRTRTQNGPCQCVPVEALLGLSWLGCTVETRTEQATGSWEV